MRMQIEAKSKIDKFKSMGLSDPFNPSRGLAEAYKYVESLEFGVDVYKGVKNSKTNPPKSIFVPSKLMCRKMIKAIVTFGH